MNKLEKLATKDAKVLIKVIHHVDAMLIDHPEYEELVLEGIRKLDNPVVKTGPSPARKLGYVVVAGVVIYRTKRFQRFMDQVKANKAEIQKNQETHTA